jgi:hypothetical protein
LFWLFVCISYQNRCLLAYGLYPAPETALPVLLFSATWLPEPVVVVPESTKALCWFAWPMADPALEPPDPTETALPVLVFVTAWLHEPVVVVPDIQAPNCLFSWAMIDSAPVCAMAAFEVVAARTRSPVAIIVATMVNTLFVPIFCY